MKVRILKPPSGDAGVYTGIGEDFQFGETVEAVWLDKKKSGILVKGSEFIRLGGSIDAFKHPDKEYIWGSFEELL